MKTVVTIAALLLMFSGDTRAQSAAAPEWFINDIAALTAGTGRWVTDNSAYKSDQEPFDAYVTEWKASFDGTTMSGRLFGIKDGMETGNFWEFRQYWHPERKEAVLEQFGWGGTVGIGTIWLADSATKSDQMFYSIDGTTTRTGHVSRFSDSDSYITESFDIAGDVWTLKRRYTWRRIVSDEQ